MPEMMPVIYLRKQTINTALFLRKAAELIGTLLDSCFFRHVDATKCFYLHYTLLRPMRLLKCDDSPSRYPLTLHKSCIERRCRAATGMQANKQSAKDPKQIEPNMVFWPTPSVRLCLSLHSRYLVSRQRTKKSRF